ncbi:ribosomal protein S18 acetylase RimI-like enzyme [Sphaerotilus mobilis]|uniref:Ribosomal protein S18 acetylase RimI-like enzyme n=2 Tax=Sphaerotilus mobilis TaxID=47994 RepID=A0A4Q7LWH3_9BURK|nr:ribosomal protein S18 acetylase RimI-like enzyme [Sphaerotilus mobilis]
MHIRPAAPQDAPEISQLISSVAHFFTLDPSGKGAERFMVSIGAEAIGGYIRSPDFYYVVATRGATLAGVAALRDGRHLFHLFVAPEFQKHGLARKLWLALKSRAARGVEVFTVNSTPFAVLVYERLGFVVAGPKVETNGIAFVPMTLSPKAVAG